jgi:hypothetical protein
MPLRGEKLDDIDFYSLSLFPPTCSVMKMWRLRSSVAKAPAGCDGHAPFGFLIRPLQAGNLQGRER